MNDERKRTRLCYLLLLGAPCLACLLTFVVTEFGSGFHSLDDHVVLASWVIATIGPAIGAALAPGLNPGLRIVFAVGSAITGAVVYLLVMFAIMVANFTE